MKPPILIALFALGATFPAQAQTTISPTARSAYAANLGWINFAGNDTNGTVIGEFVCSGYIYSANCGWIHLGDGTPANGIRYQNNSNTDYGVNLTDYACTAPGIHEAKLRGLAYGANIGWINFEDTGNARVNLISGIFRGYAYGANVGWINLGELNANVRVVTTSISPGMDSEPDGIADAYEYTHAGDLLTMKATTDSDGDGVLDIDEYRADTDPNDPAERLHITQIADSVEPNHFDITFTTRPTRQYRVEESTNLQTSQWFEVTPPIKPEDATHTVSVKKPRNPFFFWRIIVQLPLQQ